MRNIINRSTVDFVIKILKDIDPVVGAALVRTKGVLETINTIVEHNYSAEFEYKGIYCKVYPGTPYVD